MNAQTIAGLVLASVTLLIVRQARVAWRKDERFESVVLAVLLTYILVEPFIK